MKRGFAILLLASGAFFLWCFADDRASLLVRTYFWGDRAFDSEIWKRSHGNDDHLNPVQQDVRGTMLHNFLRTHRLAGMTQAQVISLLGEPDWGGNDGGYAIGNQSGMKIDADVFYIEYGTDGKVARYYTEQK